MAISDKEIMGVATRIPPIHIDMFTTSEGVLSPSMGHVKLLRAFFGKDGVAAAQMIRKGTASHLIIEEFGEGLRSNFNNNVKQRFNLPYSTETGAFFMRAQSHAVQTIDSVIGKALPEFKHSLGVVNGIRRFSSDPVRFLEMLSRSADPRVGKPLDPNYIQQINRHVLLTRIIAEGEARSINGHLDQELSQINDYLDEHLYADPMIGQRRRETIYVQHDNETNSMVKMGMISSAETHTKRHIFPVREMVGGVPVYAEIRKKDPVSEGLKAIKKGIKYNNGWIDVTGDVQDNAGIQIVVLDSAQGLDSVMDRFVDVLSGYPAGIRHIEPDDEVDKNGGQSENTRFRRLKIWIGQMPVPFEVKFEELSDHLNSQVEVGIRAENDLFNGGAHEMYQLRRMFDVVPVLFPPEIYNVDTQAAIKARMERKAQELRALDVVDMDAKIPDHLYDMVQ